MLRRYNPSGRVFGVAALMVTVPFAAYSPAFAQSDRTRPVSLEAGTVIPVRLNDPLSSKDSQKGDTFTATVRTPDDNKNDNSDYADYSSLPVGTKIEGVVTSVRQKEDKNPGVLELAFRRIRLPNGRSYPISGSLIGLDNKSVTRTSDGRLIAKPGHKNDRLTYVGYGAGAGLIAGILTKHTLEDTLIGGGLGYLFGSLQKGSSSPNDVSLKAGQEMGVRLDRSVSYSDYQDTQGDYRNSEDRFHRVRRPADRDNLDNNSDRSDNPTDIGVLIGDQNVNFASTARPVMANGQVLVPVAPVMSAAGISYRYDAGRREIRANSDAGIVRLALGSRIATVNGSRRVRLPAPAQRLNGTIYVPTKFLSLATGSEVTWDEASRTVVINR